MKLTRRLFLGGLTATALSPTIATAKPTPDTVAEVMPAEKRRTETSPVRMSWDPCREPDFLYTNVYIKRGGHETVRYQVPATQTYFEVPEDIAPQYGESMQVRICHVDRTRENEWSITNASSSNNQKRRKGTVRGVSSV